MTHRYAGRYGPLAFTDLEGNADPAATVDVFLPGTTTRAALYSARDRSGTVSNPLPTARAVGVPGVDTAGNTMFFVDPGEYDIRVTFGSGGFSGQTKTFKVSVAPNALETEDERSERLSGIAAARAYADTGDSALHVALTAELNAALAGITSGTGLAFKGQWSSAAIYSTGDVVLYDGSSYAATEGIGPDPTPPAGNSLWQLLSQGVSAALQNLINTHEARLDLIDQQLANGGGGGGGGGGVTLATLPSDALIAYQHGADIAPEHTVEAARLSTAVGARGIHAVVRRLADNTLVAFTDADVSRVTTGTGNVIDYTAPGWQPLALDAEAWFAPPWTGLKVIMLQRLLDDFGGRSFLVLEPATGGARSQLLTEIAERGLQKGSAVVCDDVTTVATVRAAGCQALLRLADTSSAPEALQSGAEILAAVDSVSSADLDSLLGQMAAYPNTKLWGWDVSTRRQRDRMRSHGVTGLVTREPGYLNTSAQIKKAATWATQTYPHGMIPGGIDPRPKFAGTEQLRLDATDGQQWTLLGEQAPILDDFTLDVEFQWGTLPAEASPLDRVGIAFGQVNDDDFTWSGTLFDPAVAAPDAVDRNNLRDGYLALFSKAGTVRLFKVDRSANTVTELANAAGTAFVAGTYVTLRVQISGGNVTAAVVGTAATVTVADASYRGGYVSLGKLGSVQSARFRNLVVSGVTVTPPAIPTTTLYAVRAAANDPNTTADTSTALKAWQNLNAAPPTGVGPLDARRSVESFATGIPATWATSAGAFDEANGADPSLYSFRTNWQRMIDGTDDAALAAFINSIPSGHTVYIAWAPQADTFTDPLETNNLGAAGFVAGFQHFSSVVKAQGRSNVHVMLVLNLRELIAAGNAEQWWPGNNAVDVVGIRAVNGYDAAAGVTQWDLVDDLLAGPVDFAISHGKQWGVVEAGTRGDTTRPARKSTWISNLGAWSEANPRALFISYANANPYWLRDDPLAVDAYAALVTPGGGGGTPATPPGFKAITLVERSNVTSINFDLPAGIADGDEVLLFVATGLNSPTLSDPTTGGWTSLAPQQNKDATTRLATRGWRKKWHTGDPITGVIPSDVSTRASVACLTYDSAATAEDVVATVIDTDTDAIVPSPGVTTTIDQDRVIRFFAHRGLATSWVAPAGTTVRGQQFASNSAGAAILITDELAAAAGAVAGKSATSDIANGYSIGWTVALKPSGTGGGGGGGGGTPGWNVPLHAPWYGSSAGNDGAGGDTRSPVQCYTDLDSAIATAMGRSAPVLKLRHSFTPSFPSGFGGMPCSGDVGIMPAGSASLANFNLGYNAAYDGSKNAAIAALVNSFPDNGHTYYLVGNHEPENDCAGNGCELDATGRLHWRMAQVHFIRTVLAQGRANVIPMTILMGWTFNPASGRNPDDYNMLGTSLGSGSGAPAPLTADEKVGFVWGVDAYQNSLSGTFLSTWQAAWNYGYTQGARRFGLGEIGFRSDGSTAADDAEENYFKSTTNNALFRQGVATWESTHSGGKGEVLAYWHSYIGGSTATARGVYTFHSNRVRKAFGDACVALQG